MTQVAVKAQVEAIKNATEKATRSKEAALKFLTDAGIIKQPKTAKSPKETEKK